jgi:NADH-quinone oxidoreductase subunit M
MPAAAKYQFAEAYTWIPRFHINYIVGIDGISILLVLLTTFIMPFCVLASWKYIQKGSALHVLPADHGNLHDRGVCGP